MTPRPIRSIPCLHLHLHHHIPIRLFSVPLAITGSPLAVPTSRVTDKVVHRSLRALRGFLCYPFKACGESFLSARPLSPPGAATRAQAPARGCVRVCVCACRRVHACVSVCMRAQGRAGPCTPACRRPPPLHALCSAAPAPRGPRLRGWHTPVCPSVPGVPGCGAAPCCWFCALCSPAHPVWVRGDPEGKLQVVCLVRCPAGALPAAASLVRCPAGWEGAAAPGVFSWGMLLGLAQRRRCPANPWGPSSWHGQAMDAAGLHVVSSREQIFSGGGGVGGCRRTALLCPGDCCQLAEGLCLCPGDSGAGDCAGRPPGTS